MHGPDWVLGLLIGITVAALVLGLAGLIVLFWFVWRQRATWWRWPAMAAIGWFLLGAFLSLGLVIVEPAGSTASDSVGFGFLASLAVVALLGLPVLLWHVWRRKQSWWRWPALVGIAWLLLSTGALVQQLAAQLR